MIKEMQMKIEVLNGKLESKEVEIKVLEDSEEVTELVVGYQNGTIA